MKISTLSKVWNRFPGLGQRALMALALAFSFSFTTACDAEGDDDDGDALPAVDCDSVEVPRFSELDWGSCVGCHAAGLEGDARQGAPDDINYDSYEEAMMDPYEAVESVIEGEMPPSGMLDEAAIEQLNIWAQCGAPE